MSRTRGTANSVSLFPFLAVLICAMGALIFLLIVTTRRIRSDARAELLESNSVASLPEPVPIDDPTPPTPPAPKIEAVDLDAPLRARLIKLEAERDHARGHLTQQQDITGQLATAVRQNAATTADVETRLQRLRDEQKNDGRDRDLISRERRQLSEQVSTLNTQAARIRRDQASAQSKYAFVAFDGQSGTIRRPILIECTVEGLRFLPEDVLLSEKDLKGFLWDNNPLLDASRALIAYWTAKHRVDSPDAEKEPEPYVLMIVRPKGAAAFYAARKMLRNLKQPYGYELLQGDHELDMPDPDEGARRVCRSTIDRMLAERDHQIASVANGGPGRDGGIGFRRGTGERFDPALERSLLGGNGFEKAGRSGARKRAAVPSKVFKPIAGQVTGSGDGRGPNNTTPGITDLTSGTSRKNGQTSGSDPTNGGTRRRRGSLVIELPPETTGNEVTRSSQAGQPGTGPAFGNPNQTSGPNKSPNSGQLGAGGSQPTTNPKVSRVANTRSARPKGEVTFPDFGRGNSGEGGSANGGSASGGSPNAGSASASSTGGGSRGSLEQILEQRWGRSRRRGTIGYERDVPIVIRANRIVIGNKFEVPVGQGRTAAELTETVVRAIDRYAESWEPPPNQFYWVPTVRFRISPGGNLYYERLHGRLNRLGIGTSVDFTLDSGNPSQKPE
jgi:hypothetical protein